MNGTSRKYPASEVPGGVYAAHHMRFTLWAKSLRAVPSASLIQKEWGVSRATTYRLRAVWIEVSEHFADEKRRAAA